MSRSVVAGLLTLFILGSSATAQVPYLLSYQGRVASGGTNFTGIGQFKFALVSGGTSAAASASASASVSFGFLVQIIVTSGGAGYTTAPMVAITDATGSGASAVAHVANGQVVSITVLDAGSGYSASPTVTIVPPPANVSYSTHWSHDGTSSAGGEPSSFIPVAVSHGLFTVLLGDTMLPNMSSLTPDAFTNADTRLRLWFNDSVNGFSQLIPDQRISSVGYALVADTVRDSSITSAKLAPNSITSAKVAPGSITANQLADGAVTSDKLARDVTLDQPPGAVALSTNGNDTNLISLGYIRVANSRVVRDEWSMKPSPPLLRDFHPKAAVWTGNEVVNFGSGRTPANELNGILGERFSPSNNLRRIVSMSGAPSFPYFWNLLGSAVWTGTEAVLFGFTNGLAGSSTTLSGRYNPTTDSWRALGIPSNLSSNINRASVFWTGRELILWAGAYYGGAMYRPDMSAWTPISGSGAPPASTPAVWTGSAMIVFNGNGATGGKFNPSSKVWENISEIGSPEFDSLSDALWTGSEAIVIGEIGSWS